MRTQVWLAVAWGMVLLAVSERPAAAFYDPHAGRWLTRDPIEEEGGVNLYAFLANNNMDAVDLLGSKIVSLSVKGDGDSDIETLPGHSWYASLTPVYRDVGQGSTLGYRGGVGYEPPPLYWPFGKGNAHSIGLFKFEAVADWCIPSDRNLAVWQNTLRNLEVYWVNKKGTKVMYKQDSGPTPDGPTGRFVSVLDINQQQIQSGRNTKIYSWDAPRLAVPHPAQGNTYYLSVPRCFRWSRRRGWIGWGDDTGKTVS